MHVQICGLVPVVKLLARATGSGYYGKWNPLHSLQYNWIHSHLITNNIIDMFHVCQLSHRAEGPVRARRARVSEPDELTSGEWTDCAARQG